MMTLECCLTETSGLRHYDPMSHTVTISWHCAPSPCPILVTPAPGSDKYQFCKHWWPQQDSKKLLAIKYSLWGCHFMLKSISRLWTHPREVGVFWRMPSARVERAGWASAQLYNLEYILKLRPQINFQIKYLAFFLSLQYKVSQKH